MKKYDSTRFANATVWYSLHSYTKFQHVGIIGTTKMKGYIPTQKQNTKTEADGSPCPF